MTTKRFLQDFLSDYKQHPSHEKELIAGYAKHLDAREQNIAETELVKCRNTFRYEPVETAIEALEARLKDVRKASNEGKHQ